MKKSLIALNLCILIALFSCSSDSDDDGQTPPPDNTVDVTYNGTIKAIMDANCIGCHGSTPSNNAPMSLTTYNEVRSAVETRSLITRVENGSMPPNGDLTETQIKAIKDWQSGGFLE